MKNLEYSKYASTQEKIRKTASDMMQKWVDKNGVEDRQKTIQFAKALSDKYGEAAASYACDMYDAIATSQNAKVPPAVPADTASWEEVGKAINGSLKQSIDGNLISGVVERLVKQAGEDTMLHNAARDRAEFAWVPDGGACAFCIMLASRGWQRASKNLQNSHAEHIHANCGCEFAIRFDKNTNVKGYNPDALKRMYDSAAPGKNSNVKLKELRNQLSNNIDIKETGGKHYKPLFDDDKKDIKAAEEYRKISRVYDADIIAKNTGYEVEEIEEIKRHIFFDKHDTRNGYRNLDPDYDIAVAWKRLKEGNYKDRDILLLKHELLESKLEKEYNLPISEAHKMAKEKYNWEERLDIETDQAGEPYGIL